ncbi:unnamed protein product [Phytophthora fragariaefolia]|uniref:Unnamed protein product n=1 Tax=Phytophthora fragariaefolia TaxID=1490495 RepID=A0A9W6TP04_9STRA|nr:unnamed protein product [Phytophthora fragariaefolia]
MHERSVTQSVGRRQQEKNDDRTQQEESAKDAVNSFIETDPEAASRGTCTAYNMVFKTKQDAEGLIERLKVSLVAGGNEQTFGVRKFLGVPMNYNEDNGYDLDQTVMVLEVMRDHGMEQVHGVRTPLGPELNKVRGGDGEMLPAGGDGVVAVKRFQPLVGRLMWVARCTHPDIAFAVHKASRCTHETTAKELRLSMQCNREVGELLKVAAYSDADHGVDKEDRKAVTGGLVTVNGMSVSWAYKDQGGVSRSTMEAE